MSFQIKRPIKAFVEQIQDQTSAVNLGGWNLAKCKRAERLLLKGHSPAQVGSILCLSQDQISELEVDASEIEPKPELESPDEWRKRKSFEIEKRLVSITENHLSGVEGLSPGMLDPETMSTVKDASAIAHKWLRNGEEGSKSLTINFGALAQVKAPHSLAGTGNVIEVDSETVSEGEREVG